MTAAAPSGAVSVLRTPQVVRVLVASLVGRLPLGAAPLALLLFARETMTLALAGALVAAYTAGVAVGQPLLARIADRWGQPAVMWAGVTLSTAGFLTIVAGSGPRDGGDRGGRGWFGSAPVRGVPAGAVDGSGR